MLMSSSNKHITGSRGGIAMYKSRVAGFEIDLVLVLSRGSRPRPIGA